MKLNELRDNPGARLKSKRLGRGIGSGKGKTSGKGVKGQKARDGRRAERLRGRPDADLPAAARSAASSTSFRKEYAPVNLGTLAGAIDAGKLDAAAADHRGDAAQPPAWCAAARIDGVRLLANGELRRGGHHHGRRRLGVGDRRGRAGRRQRHHHGRGQAGAEASAAEAWPACIAGLRALTCAGRHDGLCASGAPPA